MPNKLTKAAAFTDIHFGAKNNSDQHNQDCLNFIKWFCGNAINNKADHVVFLGDWFENRSAINVSTLHYSYLGAQLLNDLGIPVFFLVGNHDLYFRHTRDIFATSHFGTLSNFVLINTPTIVHEIESSPLMCPFLFPSEYNDLLLYTKTKVWWGHFEFKGFIVTGYSITMKSGTDHTQFKGPDYIFSGHFHKRQTGGNVVYIGNTFPTNYSDADDAERGMMVFDYKSNTPSFYNWVDCPKYTRLLLSNLLDDEPQLPEGARVQCIMDIPITFEESTAIKQSYTDKFKLREFSITESVDISDAIANNEADVELLTEEGEMVDGNINELVVHMIKSIDTELIDSELLVNIYRGLK